MNETTRLTADPSNEFRARFTTAEFELMCESGVFADMKLDLVDGELERMQSPKNLHGMRQAQVVFRLAQVFGVDLVRGSVGIDLGNNTLLECDAAVLRHPVVENRRIAATDVLLAVEIAETTVKRDLGMKRRKYGGSDIPYYWVVDGGAGLTYVFARPSDRGYEEEGEVRFGLPIIVPGTTLEVTLD